MEKHDQEPPSLSSQIAFWKIYMKPFTRALRCLQCKQVDVLIYILEHTRSSDNTLSATYRQISNATGVSLDTVTRIMGKLQKIGFLTKVHNGLYCVSPDVIMKGDDRKKMMLLHIHADLLRGKSKA